MDRTDRHTDQAAGDEPGIARGVRFPPDLIVAAGVIAFCALAYTITLTFKEAPAAVAQNVQPATFPRLVIAVMAVLAAVVGLQAYRRPGRRPAAMPAMVPVSATVMIAFVATFQLLGIVPAMVLLCAGLPVLWGERRWRLILPFALLLPAAVMLLFGTVLGVYFEPSPLVPW